MIGSDTHKTKYCALKVVISDINFRKLTIMQFDDLFAMPLKKSKLHTFYLVFGTMILFMVLSSFEFKKDQSEAIFYLSPGGKDSNPGTREQPMKTFEAARDAARDMEAANHRIVILPGEYFLTKPFELDSRDNGLTIEAEQTGTVIINGGSLVTGWYRDGDKFWCTDLPGVKEGTWDFRALVVNGRMAERARFPDTATFLHQQVWNVKLFPSIPESWERNPTPEELITMVYDPRDIPHGLDVRNAEVRVYHMWSESLVGVARNDIQRHALIFSSPCIDAPGAFGIKKYVIFNTREGMTRPGQWYLDRTGGHMVYWPLKDEEMERTKVIAPRMEQIFHISGTREKKVEKITIRGLSFNVTTTPLKFVGEHADSLKGAVNIEFANQCNLERLNVFNLGGTGISARQMTDCRIVGCNIHHTGGAGALFEGSDSFISGNHIHDTGINYPSAAGLKIPGGEHMRIYRNEIYNTPYSGIIIFGSDHLIEENHVYRVMQVLHDGAAIFGIGKRLIYRGNLVHDIVEAGKGYGGFSYYFDAGAGTYDCLMERNVSLRVEKPVLFNVTSNVTCRDNFFISDGDMGIYFSRSFDCNFERNILIAPGKFTIGQPNAIKTWKDNLIYRNGQVINGVLQAFTIDSTMPPNSIPGRRGPIKAVRVSKAPTLDGNIDLDEWPGEFYYLDREPSRLRNSGWPPIVKLAYDNKFLYLGITVVMADPGKISRGSIWGKDDGLEVSIAGKTSEGTPAIFVVRLYADGTVQSLSDAGAPAALAQRLGKELRVITKDQKPTVSLYHPGPYEGGGWSCEWAVPFKALGLKPAPGMKVDFNMCTYVNEYGKWHCWEGTLGESWQVEKGGVLSLQ